MSALAESYRSLRSALVLSPVTVLGLRGGDHARPIEDPHVILVTSPAPGDGKTTTVANLAVTMAEAGREVLVLGCDFRRPEIHAYFGVPHSPGIADVLMARWETAAWRTSSGPPEFPACPIAPSGSKLRSFGDVAAAGRELVDQARQLADVVIIDTAPLLATNDASELIPACDAVVVVSRIGKTSRDSSRRTRFLLERLGAPVAGVVAVGVPDSDTSYASYYTAAAAEGGRRGSAARQARSGLPGGTRGGPGGRSGQRRNPGHGARSGIRRGDFDRRCPGVPSNRPSASRSSSPRWKQTARGRSRWARRQTVATALGRSGTKPRSPSVGVTTTARLR